MELRTAIDEKIRFDSIKGLDQQRALETLLNEGFGVRAGQSFYDDFPVWDERRGAYFFRVGAYDGSELVASAGIRIADLNTPCGALPVAMVGAVVTQAERRGQGLASQCVQLVEKWAIQRGVAVIFLWGSEHAMYRRLGYELAGIQTRMRLEDLPLGHTSDVSAVKIGRGWTPGLMKLMGQRTDGLAIRPIDALWLSQHRNVEWRWTGSENSPTAYVAVGRGIDLAGYVHEWGGEKEGLVSLLRDLRENTPGLELLGHPKLFSRQGWLWNDRALEAMCMARIIDLQRLLLSFRVHRNTDWYQEWLSKPEREQITAIFGNPQSPTTSRQGLPLACWLWGLDGA